MSHILLVLTRDLTQGSNMLTECLNIVTHPGHFAIAKFKISIFVLAQTVLAHFRFLAKLVLAEFGFWPKLGFDLVAILAQI